MQSRSTKRFMKAGTTNSTSPAEGNIPNSVFPTPTSLENAKLPKLAFGSTTPFVEGSEGALAIHQEAATIPLIMGHVGRRTKNFSILRRSSRRRPMPVQRGSPFNRNNEPSFLAVSKVGRTLLEDKENLVPATCPILSILDEISRRINLAIIYSPVLSSLPVQSQKGGLFDGEKLSLFRKRELDLSLVTIFRPAGLPFKADHDTTFLAYNLVARYARNSTLVRTATRNQLYLAALLVAFKFNEEEDAEIAQLGEAIMNHGMAPPTFIIPTARDVIRQESKLLREIGWHIDDIVTPLSLLTAFLQCFPSLNEEATIKIRRRVECLISILLCSTKTCDAMEPWWGMAHLWVTFLLVVALFEKLPVNSNQMQVILDTSTYLYILFTCHHPTGSPSSKLPLMPLSTKDKQFKQVRCEYEEFVKSVDWIFFKAELSINT